jgi:hypothetical protein
LAGLTYNLKKINRGVAYVLDGSSLSLNLEKSKNYDKDEILSMFSANLEANYKRGRTKKPIVQISLNPNPKDDVSDMDYLYIVQDYLEQMGFEGQPYVVFKHEDIDRPHIHILTTNVKLDGKKISDKFSIKRSIAVCEELEKKYNLVPTIKQAAQEVQEKISLSQRDCFFNIKKGENIKTQIRRITSFVNQKYEFESENEYRALMRLFGVDAEFIKCENKTQNKGIIFYGINTNGTRITEPIRAVVIQKGLLKTIESKIRKSQQTLTIPNIQRTIKSKLDFVKTANCRVDFYEKLAEKNMDICFRKSDSGRIYGATIVDHDFGVVANGSKLGKAYSANVFNDMFAAFDSGKVNQHAVSISTEHHQAQQYHENFQNDHALTISGGFSAGFGYYDRVGEDEKESENDKLNKEIEKRKRGLKR